MKKINNIYAIGDLQGCYSSLERLLDKINFDPNGDQVWFVGDLVNRGKESLQTLKFIYSLGNAAKIVLGNHDLFLLTVFHGYYQTRPQDTIQDILQADEAPELMHWLKQQPLLYHAENYTMVHAGIPPQWTLSEAENYAAEVSLALRTNTEKFLQHLFGNQPDTWSEELSGYDRLRYISNAFTRMRFCYPDGRLDLSYKGDLEHYMGEAKPWFAITERRTREDKIIFGHWAALRGKADSKNVFALDTGCVWGEELTAMRLSDQRLFSVRGG